MDLTISDSPLSLTTMVGGTFPELVQSGLSTPPNSSTEGESSEAFFVRSAPQPVPRKLRKLSHPPPSFHALSTPMNQSDLSFVADEPPSSEHSNFPFIFPSRSSSLNNGRTFKCQSDSGHSYAYTRSSTFLSMNNSQTGNPLLRSLSALNVRKSATSSLAPTRKLTKHRTSAGNSFKPLPEPKSLPMLPPSPPSKSVEQLDNPPKRRTSISFAFTVALKRRLSMSKSKVKQEQPIELSPEIPPWPKFKGKGVEKSLPSPPPPSPPAKDANMARVPLPPTPTSEKEKKYQKKKFIIGADDHDVAPLPVPPFLPHYPSDPLPQFSSPTELVYDPSQDHEPALSNSSHLRPSLIRRHEARLEGGQPSVNITASTQRRWTLAMAMTSDQLTDEVFVEEVERIRRDSSRVLDEHDQSRARSVEGVGGFRGWEFGYLDPDSDYVSGEEEERDEPFQDTYDVLERSMPDLSRSRSVTGFTDKLSERSASVMNMTLPNSGPNPDPAKVWSSALHALLITRDLLRTERNYLEQLKVLLSSSPCATTPAAQVFAETAFLWNMPLSSSGLASASGLFNLAASDSEKLNTATIQWPESPSPMLMHTYLLSLIVLSSCLLTEWAKDPTVVGVARVLVEKEEEVERAFVGWCGAVGGWFTGKEDGSDKKTKYRKTTEEDGLYEKNRRRRLSKSKFSLPPSSNSLNAVSPILVPISAPSAISPIPSSSHTIAARPLASRRSTRDTAQINWRKSMSNVPDVLQYSHTSTEATFPTTTKPLESAGPSVGHSKERSLSEAVRVRRASTYFGSGLTDSRKGDESRERGRNVSHSNRAEVARSRSHGVLSRAAWSDQRSPPKQYQEGLVDGKGRKVHSVRELGILPVQRVTRYALLFRDLLKVTPETSPSRPVLLSASEAAIRIAAKCDRAQGNAEFFFGIPVVGSSRT